MKTTAIYPNRLEMRRQVEKERGILEFGNERTRFLLPDGSVFAIGYTRVVYGDHGPYVEFERRHIQCKLRRKFANALPKDAYYEWLHPVGFPDVKVYDQKRDVKKLKNPPGGKGYNRAEGYADYVVGMIYVSPWELKCNQPE